jgi:hypothetical protein
MRRILALLPFIALAQVGCYGASSNDSPADPTEVKDEGAYVRVRAEVELRHVERCCEEAGARGVDRSYMDAIRRGLSEDRPARESGARYDPEAAAQCLAALADWVCLDQKEPGPVVVNSPCGRIYQRGDRALGESCESDYDCAEPDGTTTTCGVSDVTSEGLVYACQVLDVVREGEPCESPEPLLALYCQWPLLCHPETARCVALAERGEECITGSAWGDTCATGSVCDRLGSATCIEPIAKGEPCEDDGELCESLACADGLCRPAIYDTTACIW